MAVVLRVGVHEAGGILGWHGSVRVLAAVEVLRICRRELLRLDATVNFGSAGVAGRGTGAAPDITGDGVGCTGAVARLQSVGGRGGYPINGATLHGRNMGANGLGGGVVEGASVAGGTVGHPGLGARVELEWLGCRVEGGWTSILIKVHATSELGGHVVINFGVVVERALVGG